jgi:hypothetical protein
MNDAPAATLPPIPLVELGARPPAALVATQRDRAAALLAAADRRFPGPAVALGDRLSRRWLELSANPYLDEIAAVAEALGAPGAWFLNVNYEWACTGGVAPSPDGRGSRLLRVLDWRMEGLGANILAVRREGPAGSWVDLTWPGFVGCIQGLAPRRFAAALNQAPLRRRTGTKALDWAAMRGAVWRRRALPPAHLLRRAFDEARDYREARALLTETPLALPAIFLLSGARPGEGCAIERLEEQAFVRDAPTVAANHWIEAPERARPRGQESETRHRLLGDAQSEASGDFARGDFAWLVPPILNPTTRLAMVAEPASGRLIAQGYEPGGPATAVLRLDSVSDTRRRPFRTQDSGPEFPLTGRAPRL